MRDRTKAQYVPRPFTSTVHLPRLVSSPMPAALGLQGASNRYRSGFAAGPYIRGILGKIKNVGTNLGPAGTVTCGSLL